MLNVAKSKSAGNSIQWEIGIAEKIDLADSSQD
jgi:hypothetical protein